MTPRTICLLILGISLACAPLAADSIPLTKGTLGSGFDPVTGNGGGPGGTLFGPGGSISLSVAEFFSPPGLHQCFIGCTLDQIRQFGLMTLATPFSGLTAIGFGTFDQVTTHFDFSTSGLLTVRGKAHGSGTFQECVPIDIVHSLDCNPVGPIFFVEDHGQWRYVAHFDRDPVTPGLWIFRDVTITSVPEPGTLLLVATGLLGLRVIRRRS